jgi:hypothetical protein
MRRAFQKYSALALDDEDRGGLTAADVTALSLGRIERGEHALDKLAGGVEVGLQHRVRHRGAFHHVRLHGDAVAGAMCRLRYAAAAGVGRDIAGGVDHCDLAQHFAGVTGDERAERFGRGLAGAHEVEAERAVRRVGPPAWRQRRRQPPQGTVGPTEIV